MTGFEMFLIAGIGFGLGLFFRVGVLLLAAVVLSVIIMAPGYGGGDSVGLWSWGVAVLGLNSGYLAGLMARSIG